MTRSNEHGQPIGEPVDWSPRQPPGRVRLEGRYVALEPVAAGHAEALHASLCGPDDTSLWTYRPDDPPTDVAAMQERIATWADDPVNLTWALVPTATGEAAGVASYFRIDPANGSAEIAAVLFARVLQRTREATEAIMLLASYAFDELGYRRLEWKLDSHNAPSASAARRFGFSYEGRFRHAMVYRGRNRDTDWFAMTDDDWRSLRPAYDRWLDPANFDERGEQREKLSVLTTR